MWGLRFCSGLETVKTQWDRHPKLWPFPVFVLTGICVVRKWEDCRRSCRKGRPQIPQPEQWTNNSNICFLRRVNRLRNEVLEILARIVKKSITSNDPFPSTLILTKPPSYGEETWVRSVVGPFPLRNVSPLISTYSSPGKTIRPARCHQRFSHIAQGIHIFCGQYLFGLGIVQKYSLKML